MKFLWSVFSAWLAKPVYQAAIIILIVIIIIMAVKMYQANKGETTA